MKNLQKGFIVPVLLVIIALLVVGGGVYIYKIKKSEIPPANTQTSPVTTKTNTPTSKTDTSFVGANEQKVLSVAREAIGALAARDYQKLQGLVSPDGLNVDLYPHFDTKKNLIAKNEVDQIPRDTKTYFWGYTDGKGDPINLTRAEFLTKYIYTNAVDYSKAPEVAVNKKLGGGNSSYSIDKDVSGRTYAAFYFPGINPKNAGMDWTTLYLIFDSVNGEYKLRGMAKDNWTI